MFYEHIILELIKHALWNEKALISNEDWSSIEQTANQQGVLSMLYLGAKDNADLFPVEVLKAWRADLLSCIMRNQEVNAVQQQVTGWMQEQGIRAAILKGVSCSMYYPMPETRALGDIDLLIDEENMLAVGEYLKTIGFEKAKSNHTFHVGYHKEGIALELHYGISKFPDSTGGREAQKFVNEFLDDARMVELNGMKFPALSESHQALMLLTHMERHLVLEGIGLRQLCDWAVFVNGSAKEHWQEKTLEMLDKCGLLTFAKVVTKTCVDYLGLIPSKAEWCMDIDAKTTQMMMEDIFRSGNMGAAEEDNTSSLFFDRTQLGKKGQNRLTGLIKQLSKLSYRHFPFTEKFKFLLPFFWVFLPARYFVRSLLGLRPKKNVAKLLDDSNQRQKLYKSLNLYETKK